MLSNFNLPSVDSLVEGVDYTEVNYDFAQRCPRGQRRDQSTGSCKDKNIVLSARRHRQKSAAQPETSNFQNNKKISTGHGDFGWAMKKGKPTLVKWGSVAGIKNADGTITKEPSE